MKLLVLGSRGMLGSAILQFFNAAPGFEIFAFDFRYALGNRLEYEDRLQQLISKHNIEFVVNAVGSIPQKNAEKKAFFEVNTFLPSDLARCLHKNIWLVQPSTDCVFSGEQATGYHETSEYDEFGDYGLSKALAEAAVLVRPRAVVIRASIIGSVGKHGMGLLDWFLSHPEGATVQGFTNHFWNGITTLEWCRVLAEMVSAGLKNGLINVSSSDVVSKFELLKIFQQLWRQDLSVHATLHKDWHNKSIDCQYRRSHIATQLHELREFLAVN